MSEYHVPPKMYFENIGGFAWMGAQPDFENPVTFYREDVVEELRQCLVMARAYPQTLANTIGESAKTTMVE